MPPCIDRRQARREKPVDSYLRSTSRARAVPVVEELPDAGNVCRPARLIAPTDRACQLPRVVARAGMERISYKLKVPKSSTVRSARNPVGSPG